MKLTEKRRSLATAFMVLCCLTIFATNSHAQKIDKNGPKAMVAGINGNTATVDQVLSNPVLTSTLKDSWVTSFTVTLIPKDRFLIGPYKTEGSRLSPRVIDSLNSVIGKPVSIVFEDIVITKNGKKIAAPPLFIKCKQ